MAISRREFLGTAALGSLAAGALQAGDQAAMPMRVLGKTGVSVSILAMGAGSRFLLFPDDEKGIAAIHKALDLGVNYIDTCDDYGADHLSERRVGMALQGRRASVFLVTKVTPRDGDSAARSIEKSLKALQTDHLDLLHVHQLTTAEDLAEIEAKGGVLERVLKLRDQKVARFVGITSHSDPEVLRTALTRHDFDCTQMALNGALVGMRNGDGHMVVNEALKTSFETVALPVAVRKKMGILGMKVFAQDALVGQASTRNLLYYTLSLPVAAAVVGMQKIEQIDENARLAKSFQPLPAEEMKRMSDALSARNKLALDLFLHRHVDA